MTTTSDDSRTHSRLILAAILALALVLRLIRLGTFPYWHDEVHNLIASEDLYALILHGNLISNHPPLPYILVAFWRFIGLGASEWTMRLLPLTFGLAAVWAMFALGRRLFGERAGLCAAFLLAIAPLHVHHSQDLKEYIYLPFVAIVMIHGLHRAIDGNRMRDWIIYGLLAGLACYTEIFVGPLLVAVNLWALTQLRSRVALWRWFAGNTLGALLFVPWLGIMLRKAVGTMVKAENWWVPPPSLAGAGFYFKAVAFGYTAAEPWFQIATAVFAILVAIGIWKAIGIDKRAASLVVTWAIVPVALVYLISLYTESIFLIRAMLPYAMALYLLAGVALAQLKPMPVRGAAFVAVSLLSAAGLMHHYQRDYTALDQPHRPGTHPPADYDRAAEFILSRWETGDVVVHCSAATWLPFSWYGFFDRPSYFAGVGGKFIADIKMGNPENTTDPRMDRYWPQEPQAIVAGAKRVWFVFGEWERKYLVGNASDAYRWMDSHFNEIESHAFRKIDVLLYLPRETMPVIERNNDDGVAAEIRYRGATAPYVKTMLDNAVVPRPAAERAGALRVRWTVDVVEGASSTDQAAFVIENVSAKPVQAMVVFVPSDALIEAASLYEADPSDEIWHVFGRHNPAPPPEHYDDPVASAHLQTAASEGELVGSVELPAGSYETLLLSLGLPGDADRGRAPILASVAGQSVYTSVLSQAGGPWKWLLTPGNTISISPDQTSNPVSVVASNPGETPLYADLSALVFRKRTADPQKMDDWPGEITLDPAEMRQFLPEGSVEFGRVDIWVFGRGIGEKTYRITRQINPE